MSPTHRSRKRIVASIAVAGAGAMLLALLSTTAQAALTTSTSSFEYLDGNTAVNSTKDWDSGAPNLVVGTEPFTGSQDNSFGQGTKEDDTAVSVGAGSIPPNKSDLSAFYVANEKGGNGHDLLYLAWERTNVLGTANMDFEVSRTSQVTNLTGSGKKTITRSAGDLLVQYDFAQGGNSPDIYLSKWLITGDTNPLLTCEAASSRPCWSEKANLSQAGSADGSISTDLKFGEAVVDLTGAGVFSASDCTGFGSVFLKSRSSDSFTSALKDFVAPKAVNISNCGSVSITKTDDDSPASALSGAGFTLYTDAAPLNNAGGHGVEDTATSLTCTTALNGTCSISSVPFGEYWVVETTTPSGYATAADQHVTVSSANASASLTFVDPRQFKVITIVCRNSDNTLYGGSVTLAGDADPLSTITSAPAGVTEAELCGLAGASFSPRLTGTYNGSVTIPQ